MSFDLANYWSQIADVKNPTLRTFLRVKLLELALVTEPNARRQVAIESLDDLCANQGQVERLFSVSKVGYETLIDLLEVVL